MRFSIGTQISHKADVNAVDVTLANQQLVAFRMVKVGNHILFMTLHQTKTIDAATSVIGV